MNVIFLGENTTTDRISHVTSNCYQLAVLCSPLVLTEFLTDNLWLISYFVGAYLCMHQRTSC